MTFQGLSLIPQSGCLVISLVDGIGLVFSVSYRPIVDSGRDAQTALLIIALMNILHAAEAFMSGVATDRRTAKFEKDLRLLVV